jgi:hypothetical protein
MDTRATPPNKESINCRLKCISSLQARHRDREQKTGWSVRFAVARLMRSAGSEDQGVYNLSHSLICSAGMVCQPGRNYAGRSAVLPLPYGRGSEWSRLGNGGRGSETVVAARKHTEPRTSVSGPRPNTVHLGGTGLLACPSLCYQCVVSYHERHLPHWQPEGAALFLTWRLHGPEVGWSCHRSPMAPL